MTKDKEMAKLSDEDAKLFHKLMDDLLYYANKKINLIKNANSKEEFFKNEIEKTVPLRNKLFANPSLIESFVEENSGRYGSEELRIVSSWKKSKEEEFFLVKHEKEQALMYSPKEKKVYGVLGITDSFSDMFDGYSPIMMKIRLLPFKGKITYEGVFFPYRISFGSSMRSSLKVESDTAIQKYGIIVSFDSAVVEKENSDEEMMRFDVKSQEDRDRYYEEIEELRKKSAMLEAVYHQEEAGIISRNIKKSLKANGIKGHFAVLADAVAASGSNEMELEENIKKIVPENKQSWIYRFKI